MSTLTDRYVSAVTRGLPDDTRADVGRELRAAIEDMVEARTGGSPAQAEREAITTLGDPERLAERYRGRPRYLVGPALYPAWLRLLTRLLWIVPPIAAAITLVGALVGAKPFGEVLGSTLWAAIFSAGQVAFWTTVGFAIAERAGAEAELSREHWSPDDLPEPAPRQVSWGDAIGSILGLSILLALVAWAWNPTVTGRGGTQLPLFDPGVRGWRWTIGALLVALILVEVVNLVRGHWTLLVAVVHAGLQVAFAAVAVWLLLGDRLVTAETRQALTDTLGWSAPEVTLRVVAGLVLAVTAWEIADAFRKATRARRELAG